MLVEGCRRRAQSSFPHTALHSHGRAPRAALHHPDPVERHYPEVAAAAATLPAATLQNGANTGDRGGPESDLPAQLRRGEGEERSSCRKSTVLR
jgi:hypothetical protein